MRAHWKRVTNFMWDNPILSVTLFVWFSCFLSIVRRKNKQTNRCWMLNVSYAMRMCVRSPMVHTILWLPIHFRSLTENSLTIYVHSFVRCEVSARGLSAQRKCIFIFLNFIQINLLLLFSVSYVLSRCHHHFNSFRCCCCCCFVTKY